MAQMSALHEEWARYGAIARLQEIDREKTAIFASFPELRGARSERRVSKPSTGLRKRRTMSAAARRRMSAGMKKYWAKRKAAER